MSDTKRQFFGTDGIRGKANVYPLTPEFTVRLGQAVAEVLLEKAREAIARTARSKQPFAHPFAYALIRLDGADTAMLHAVDAGEESRISVGSRVRPRWAAEPGGSILDLACFEVEEEG